MVILNDLSNDDLISELERAVGRVVKIQHDGEDGRYTTVAILNRFVVKEDDGSRACWVWLNDKEIRHNYRASSHPRFKGNYSLTRLS